MKAIIAFKTFNSKSYNAMKVFARIEGVSVYPKLNGLQDSQIMQIAQEIAKTLEPNLNFQATTGVIEEAGGKVPSNFYPSRPTSNRLEVDEFFSANLTPKDRLLCLLIAHNKSGIYTVFKFESLLTALFND